MVNGCEKFPLNSQIYRTDFYSFLFNEAAYYARKISEISNDIAGKGNDYFQVLTLMLIPGISLSCLMALLQTTLCCDDTVSTL